MRDSRTLVDSSTIIALATIGELELLRDIFTEIHITPFIREEILVEDYPETNRIKKSVEGWMEIIEVDGGGLQKYEKYGLAKGEASLVGIARRDDRLVLDDPVAREVAEVEGLGFTGLIGLLVEACRANLVSIEKGEGILDKLSTGDFRMTAELYRWAMGQLKGQ